MIPILELRGALLVSKGPILLWSKRYRLAIPTFALSENMFHSGSIYFASDYTGYLTGMEGNENIQVPSPKPSRQRADR